MNSLSVEKSAGQMEEIIMVARLDHIKEGSFGNKIEEMERKVERGNGGVDGEQFIDLYKQINKNKVSQL